MSFSFDSFSQEEDRGEDTLVTLYLYVMNQETLAPISNAEVHIFDGNDTVLKYSDNDGIIIHKLDTNLVYRVDVNVENSLSSFHSFTTKGIDSKTNIVREIGIIVE